MQQPSGVSLSPEQIAELVTTAKWLLGGAVTAGLGWIAFLLKITYSMGGHVAELKTVAKDMVGIKAHADQVPVILTRLGTLEGVYQRSRSDIEELKRLRPPSVPDFTTEGE